MEFSFTIDGLDRIEKASKQVQQEITRELQKALFASALKIEREAKTSILSGGKSGRIYSRGALTHRASAPGEAPASDTGRLANSVNAYMNTATKLEAFVVAGRGIVKYARMLEFGTAKMAARPFMLPAAEKSREWISARLNKAVRDGVLKTLKK